MNKWYTDSVSESTYLLNNHYIWSVMGVGTIGTTTITHLLVVVTNIKGETFVRGYHGLYLGAKLEVEISQDYLLDTVITANPAQLYTMHSVLSLQTSVDAKNPSNKLETQIGPHARSYRHAHSRKRRLIRSKFR